jgi:hypothetical protein
LKSTTPNPLEKHISITATAICYEKNSFGELFWIWPLCANKQKFINAWDFEKFFLRQKKKFFSKCQKANDWVFEKKIDEIKILISN